MTSIKTQVKVKQKSPKGLFYFRRKMQVRHEAQLCLSDVSGLMKHRMKSKNKTAIFFSESYPNGGLLEKHSCVEISSLDFSSVNAGMF